MSKITTLFIFLLLSVSVLNSAELSQVETLLLKQQKDIANLEYEIERLKQQMLLLYDRHAQIEPQLSIVRKSNSLKQIPSDFKLKKFKPSTFTLVNDTQVINLSGVVKAHLKKGDTFTSVSSRDNFIKLSGKIENGKWVSVKKDLYINQQDCKKR